MRKIFLNPFGRLRSGWRLIIFLVLFILLTTILQTTLRAVYELISSYWTIPHADSVVRTISRGLLLVSALAAGFACAHFLEALPWRSLGASFHKGWFKDLAIGSVVGFATLAVAVGIATGGRGLSFSFHNIEWIPVARSMIGSATIFFVAAFAEEAMFRGYPLQTLSRAQLTWLGVALTLALFGVAHLANPNVVRGFTLANTCLAGLWFALAYLRTRSLWLPLGLHWSWNWALGWFFGLPVSGITVVPHPLLAASDAGPTWLTGGNYGIEGGLASTIALVLSTLFVWRTSIVSPDPELKKLASEENPAPSSSVISIRPADDLA